MAIRTRHIATRFALLLAAMVAALTLSAGHVASATSSVAIQSFAFAPASMPVAVGDSATWTNDQAGVPHTVPADAGGTLVGIDEHGQAGRVNKVDR